MWRFVTRGVGVVLAIVLSTALVSCSGKSEDKPDSPDQAAPDVSASPWGKTLAKIKPDGTVDTATALSAFVQAIGPVPGVKSPGPSEDIVSGTIAIRWVTRVWSKLTEGQKRAIQNALNGITAPASGFRSVSYRPVSDPKPLPLDPKGPNVICQTKDSDGASPYRALVDDIVTKVTKRLGRGLQHPIWVAVDTKANSGGYMYTQGCKGKKVPDGKGDGCSLHVRPNANLDPSNSPDTSSALAHEVMHCFILDLVGNTRESRLPDWFGEGLPSWVGSDLGPVGGVIGGWWLEYLDTATSPLSRRTYDGIGFFVHLAETGTNPWRVIDKMTVAMADGAGTPAGWEAAGVSTGFLDSWGSGYVQGAGGMTSRAWTTTGPSLSAYRPEIDTAPGGEVVNGKSLTVNVSAEATWPVLASVSAEVVLVRPDGPASGRISLGSGQDATLSAAAGATYCTLGSDKCKCPEGSGGEGTRFTPMEKGFQYVTVTGGLSKAGVNVAGQSLEEFCRESPLVGTWRSQSTKINAELTGVARYLTTGGAGVMMTIGKDGSVTVNYSGMTPASYRMAYIYGPFKASGTITASGTDRGKFDLKRTRAGVWQPTNVTLGLVGATHMHGGGVFNERTAVNFVGPLFPGTWKIAGNRGANARKTLTIVGSGKANGWSRRVIWTFTKVK